MNLDNFVLHKIYYLVSLDDSGTQPQPGGMTLLSDVEDKRWTKIRETRQKMANLFSKLKK